MAGLRFTELQSRPMEFLDFTSLTLAEFQHRPSPSASASRRLTPLPSSAPWRRSLHPSLPRPSPYQRPPFCP